MALLDIVTKDSTNRSVTLRIIDSTDGTPETGVVWNTAGIDLWYRREGAAVVSVTEATLASLTTAHTDGGFLHISHGLYRFDLPDAAFATGANQFEVGGTVTGMVVIGGTVRLIDADLEDGVRAGLTALPNAAAGANNGLPLGDANGRVDLGSILGAAAESSQSGFLDANVEYWRGQQPGGLGASSSLIPVDLQGINDSLANKSLLVDLLTNGIGTDDKVLISTDSQTLSNITIGTVSTLTGHTVQTGDNYARLGAPAGASVSADIATAQADLDTITGTNGVLIADEEDVYHADINLTVDEANTQDEYEVVWFKNGALQTTVTTPLIAVTSRDGSTLVSSTAMTDAGSGFLTYDESTPANRVTAGEGVQVLVTATIDGSPRTFPAVVSRDSSA